MEFIVIMPAYNEEDVIAMTLETVVKQTILPKQLIVVNDGSTDQTPSIVNRFIEKYPWIKMVTNHNKAGHSPGAKIVRAFYLGFDSIATNWDFVMKLDADLDIPPNYFEEIVKIFESDPKVGMAGGICLVEQNGTWVREQTAELEHIRGAFKTYRKQCFEDIGGMKASIGWDTADEILCKYNGWKVVVRPDLEIKQFRVTGVKSGAVKVNIKAGVGTYRLRYGFWIALISAAKCGIVNRPYILTGIGFMRGWLKAWWRGDDFIVNKAEGQYIRQYRIKRMKEKYLPG